ncbi:ABC transporter permease [Pseudomarimonas salicorniae]|uniref:FtsX-like permease family protein n=1 Tax=Pseudomarimonas salicorniae TaxID=2933270 RepID=A0ABT0GC49_9GAMM|nr:FtsX-like permease family protein [Lysobacter sp. CAU 1642]MCK7592111.1 FtsX-like permease family protein [Lysobacter sp. CAU 1642]
MEIRPILSTLLRSKTAPLLIAAQVALTLAIVCNAVYIIKDRLATSSRPSGADESNSFVMAFSAARPIGDIESMQRRDLEALRGIPGVAAAAWTNQVPLGRSGWNTGGINTDPTANQPTDIQSAQYMSGDSLIDAFGLKLVEGRDFLPEEITVHDPEKEAPPLHHALITRALAEQLWPEESRYAGRQFYNGNGPEATPITVVGVIEQLQTPWAPVNPLRAESSMLLPRRYLDDYSQYIVRTEPGQRAAVMREAEKTLLALRSDRVLRFTRTMDQVRDRRYAGERLMAGLLIGVTAFLLLITASGIVGMSSLWVNQRRKQIGVRRALGARRVDILRYFLVENLLISSAGVLAGLLLALLLNDLLVRELSLPRMPVEYLVGGMVFMWILGLGSVLSPAIRAAAVPPAVATRTA